MVRGRNCRRAQSRKRGLAESTVKLIATSLLLLSVTVCGGLVAVTVVVKLSAAGKML